MRAPLPPRARRAGDTQLYDSRLFFLPLTHYLQSRLYLCSLFLISSEIASILFFLAEFLSLRWRLPFTAGPPWAWTVQCLCIPPLIGSSGRGITCSPPTPSRNDIVVVNDACGVRQQKQTNSMEATEVYRRQQNAAQKTRTSCPSTTR